jgi:hypothetical protein
MSFSPQQRSKQATADLQSIRRGFSKLNAGDFPFFFKHLSLSESLDLQDIYDDALHDAVSRGLKNEETLLEEAAQAGTWVLGDQEKIKALEWQIEKSITSAKKISDTRLKQNFLDQLPPVQEELDELRKKRGNVLSYSAENYASMQRNRAFFKRSIFKDKNLKIPVSNEQYADTLKAAAQEMDRLSEKNAMVNACYISTFFQLFCLYRKSPEIIFDLPAFKTTVYQRSLLEIAGALYNKMSNHKIPDAIADDPIKILEYDPDNKKEGSETTHGVQDLIDKSAKSGGKLTPQDLLH